MKRFIVAVIALASIPLAAFPSTVSAATPRGPITLDSVQFYSHLNCSGVPTGNPVNPATFTNGTPVIYALARYTQWQGQHSVTFTWVDPNGKIAQTPYTDSYNDNGPTYDWDAIRVAWTDNASLLGTWTLKLTIDGAPGPTQTFTLTSGTPAQLADYCMIAARAEKPSSKADFPYTSSSLVKKVKLGQKERSTLYYDFRNLAPTASIRVDIVVKRSGKVVSKFTDRCPGNCGNDYLGVSWTWNNFKPKATGKYTITGTVTVGSQKQSASTSFTVTR